MNRLNKLEVFYHERLVGTIALYQNRLAAFEYDSNWLANGSRDFLVFLRIICLMAGADCWLTDL